MAEENVEVKVEEENVEAVVAQPVELEEQGPSFGQRFLAGLKERVRKFFASLKRKPQNIGFFMLIIASVIFMCALFNFSQATIILEINFMGLMIFMNTMLSVLTLLMYMNTFPKRKNKINVIMLAITFVFMAVMIFCDIYWYVNSLPKFESYWASLTDTDIIAQAEKWSSSFTIIIVHVVFVGLSALLLATLPLYKPLIMKINTSKDIGESQLNEKIDTSEDDD